MLSSSGHCTLSGSDPRPVRRRCTSACITRRHTSSLTRRLLSKTYPPTYLENIQYNDTCSALDVKNLNTELPKHPLSKPHTPNLTSPTNKSHIIRCSNIVVWSLSAGRNAVSGSPRSARACCRAKLHRSYWNPSTACAEASSRANKAGHGNQYKQPERGRLHLLRQPKGTTGCHAKRPTR